MVIIQAPIVLHKQLAHKFETEQTLTPLSCFGTLPRCPKPLRLVLGGSWDTVSEVISNYVNWGVAVLISIVPLLVTLVTKSDDPLSNPQP